MLHFFIFYLIADEQPADVRLTDSKLLELSGQFVSVQDLREVAIKGLDISANRVERHLKGYPSNISTAAFNLMREWRDTQPDGSAAHSKITQALENTDKPFLKQFIE